MGAGQGGASRVRGWRAVAAPGLPSAAAQPANHVRFTTHASGKHWTSSQYTVGSEGQSQSMLPGCHSCNACVESGGQGDAPSDNMMRPARLAQG